jgi:uncharacterized protein (TIGR01777 family)
MKTVLITGGTGLVGKYLCKKLIEKGYVVATLGRQSKKQSDIPNYTWNIEKNELEDGALENVDYIIHLAGANIGEKRWTSKRKKEIVDSRIESSQLIFQKITENKHQLKAFISASAIGYYGAITTDKIFVETDQPSQDFLGETCRLWEESANSFESSGIRTVKIRTGVVLTYQGGALAKMITPVKVGLGASIGSGKQYMPWIHIDDLCEIYLKAIEDNNMHGAFNAVSPEHKNNGEFSKTLTKVLKKKVWFPNIPAFIMKIIFGKMSELILNGSRVSSNKLIKEGFQFKFPDLKSALEDLIFSNRK